jgi:hypothetical protein
MRGAPFPFLYFQKKCEARRSLSKKAPNQRNMASWTSSFFSERNRPHGTPFPPTTLIDMFHGRARGRNNVIVIITCETGSGQDGEREERKTSRRLNGVERPATRPQCHSFFSRGTGIRLMARFYFVKLRPWHVFDTTTRPPRRPSIVHHRVDALVVSKRPTDRSKVESSVNGHVRARTTTASLFELVVVRLCRRRRYGHSGRSHFMPPTRPMDWYAATARPTVKLCAFRTIVNYCKKNISSHDGRWIDSLDQGDGLKSSPPPPPPPPRSSFTTTGTTQPPSGDGSVVNGWEWRSLCRGT